MSDHRLLDTINSPDDLKEIPDSQLNMLCAEIREELIDTISKNGGHLASNLGAVEMTVALHRAFSTPKDKIIFDVGHQSYTHKLLTGRRSRFHTIRTRGGLSGFTRRDESVHDAFISGHSSTSISAGFGFCQAKQIRGEEGYVVSVIGDGALTGGLSYEALNNAGRSHDNLIVVLNDNKMSISKNVGAMARYLAVMRSRPAYFHLKNTVEKILLKIPLIGRPIRDGIVHFKAMLKDAIYHSNIFEDMGFSYLGPIDGHDLNKLSQALAVAKKMRRPVLLHINTIKGKGYSFAEKNPKDFHGVPSFDVETGDYAITENCFSYKFGDYLCELADKDARICAITAAMCESTGLTKFQASYKNRFYDVGIAEQHAVTFASALAVDGMVPVFAVYSSFLQRSYDQLIHDAATQNAHLILGIDRAGIVGEDGETHQGLFDVSFLNSIPNVTIYSPATYKEMYYALRRGIYEDTGLIAVRYPRGSQKGIPDDFASEDKPYSVYGAKDAEIAIVVYGRLFANVCGALKRLNKKGKKIKIIKLNRIKPVDSGAFDEALSCKHVLFYEEGMRSGGIAEGFIIRLIEKGYKGRFKIEAVEDRFVPHASVDESMKDAGLDADSIYRAVCETYSES